MVSSDMCITSVTWRMSSIGHDEPAMMPVRSEVEIEVLELRMLKLGDEHGRHAVERRAALGLDRAQGLQRIEKVGGNHHGGAVYDAVHVAQHHAKAVVERHRDADPVVLGQLHAIADQHAVVDHAVMGERRALGESRGSRCVLDIDRVVRRQRGFARPQLRGGNLFADGQQLLPAQHCRRRGFAAEDHVLQVRQSVRTRNFREGWCAIPERR